MSAIERTIGETMSSLFAGIPKEHIADMHIMQNNMKLFRERVDADQRSVTAAITALSGNTARLSEETTALSTRVVEHQGHLENLLGFEEARQAQMDDHWQSIVDLKSQLEEANKSSATQHQRLVAQLDGLRSTNDTTTSTMKNDITDLRGRIIPGLRDDSSAIALSVKRLEERFDAYSKRPSQPATLAPGPTPPRAPTPIETIPPQEDRPNSWYTRSHNPQFDNPATTGTGFASHGRPNPISTTMLDDNDEVSLLGGRITSPRSTDKERQA
jgi:hypothetical protein